MTVKGFAFFKFIGVFFSFYNFLWVCLDGRIILIFFLGIILKLFVFLLYIIFFFCIVNKKIYMYIKIFINYRNVRLKIYMYMILINLKERLKRDWRERERVREEEREVVY